MSNDVKHACSGGLGGPRRCHAILTRERGTSCSHWRYWLADLLVGAIGGALRDINVFLSSKLFTIIVVD